MTYGGLPVMVPDAAVQHWLEAKMRTGEMQEFQRRTAPQFGQEHLNFQPPQNLPFRLNTLRWPVGASEWAAFHFLCDATDLAKLRQQAYSPAYQPLTLTMESEQEPSVTGTAKPISTKLWMLPPRHCAQVDGCNDLWLISLVCDRYFWRETGTLVDVTGGTTTWTDLYSAIAAGLGELLPGGATIVPDAIPAAYLMPAEDFSTDYYGSLPALLDAVAASCGQRIVRTLDGKVLAQNALTAIANVKQQVQGQALEAGGAFSFTAGQPNDLNSLVPAYVVVTYPQTIDSVLQALTFDYFAVLSSLGLSEFKGVAGYPAAKLFRANTIRGVVASVVTNDAELQALTNQIATDFYRWRLGSLDVKFPGIVPWAPEGLHAVEWTWTGNECNTSVRRGPWQDTMDLVGVHGSSGAVDPTKIPWASIPSGAGSPLTTKGDIYAFAATNDRFPVGANGKVLQADSAQVFGLGYSTTDFDFGGKNLTNGIWQGSPVTPTYGGTGLATLTAHAVLLGEGTGNVGFATIGTSGRVLTDQGAGADPLFALITTVGTVTVGTWNADVITPTYGGTGLATLTAHAVLLGEGTGNVGFATIGTAWRYLCDNGPATDPTFKVLSYNNGNPLIEPLNSTLLYSNGAGLANSGGDLYINFRLVDSTASTGSAGQVIVSQGAGATIYSNKTKITEVYILTAGTWNADVITPTYGGTGLATLTAHAVLLGEGTGNVAFATIGTAGRLLIDQGAGADPAFTAVSGDATITSAGVTTVASASLSDAATNTATTVFAFKHATSGTPATGFGSVMFWDLQDSTTTNVNAANLTVSWATATHASRKARVVLNVYDTAAREVMRGAASGTAPMIGFLGAAESAALASPDLGTLATTFGLATGTPTFAGGNLTGNITLAGSITSSSATAGIGYSTGAGGTVTQTTSRTTGVTINKICGTITTDTTSLAALAAATFTVTNSTVAIGDVVVVSQRSGATNVKTDVRVTAVAGGSFNVTVHNIDASTAETGAIVINFAVIRSVTA